MPPTSDDPLIGQVIADRYHILELVGVGGMGRVYLAEHVALGRRCAVKTIHPALSTAADAITRFNREAANASRINHPNVAQVYDFGATGDDTLYLAMELVEGEELSTLLQQLGSLPLWRAATITVQVADALGAAHHLGIVHRDLKPENIMIGRRHDGADWVKVVDFGIAKTIEHEGGSQTVTTAGVSIGTPEYMSPEQLAGVKLDHRTDIYALGLVCFNMLTGVLPHPPVTSRESLVHRLTERPRQLAEVRPDIAWPAGVQAAIDRALAPDVEDRYHRAVDFASDLMRAAERAAGRVVTPVSSPLLAAALPARRLEAKTSTSAAASVSHAMRARRRVWPSLLIVSLAGAAAAAALTRPDEITRVALLVASIQRDSAGSKPPASATPPDTGASATELPDVVQQGSPAADGSSAALSSSVPVTAASQHARDSSAASSAGVRDDSVQIAPGDGTPPVPNVLRHPWLRANGDSGSTLRVGTDAPAEDRLAAMADELRGHVQLGLRRIAAHDFAGARATFRDANDEARIIKFTFPDPRVTRRVDALMLNGMRDAFRACELARGDTTSTDSVGVDCGALFSRWARGG